MRASPKYEKERKKRVSTSLNNLVRNSQKIVFRWLFIATQQHDDDYVYDDDDYDVGLFIQYLFLFLDNSFSWSSCQDYLIRWYPSSLKFLFYSFLYLPPVYLIYKQFFDNNRILNTHFRFQVKCVL